MAARADALHSIFDVGVEPEALKIDLRGARMFSIAIAILRPVEQSVDDDGPSNRGDAFGLIAHRSVDAFRNIGRVG